MDEGKIAQSWKETLLENMPLLSDLTAQVIRPAASKFLANQNGTFKSLVKGRIRPLLKSDAEFEDMYTSMGLEIDCSNHDLPPIVVNELGTNILLFNSVNDWHIAECKRRTNLSLAFYEIDDFYDFSPDNIMDFCSSSDRSKLLINQKLKDFVSALRHTDAIISEIIEDLTRKPNPTRLPYPYEYESVFQSTKEFLLQVLQSRINAEELSQPCPKPDNSKQLDIDTQQRPTRPTTARSATVSPSSTTEGPGFVNPFLLNAFNFRNQ